MLFNLDRNIPIEISSSATLVILTATAKIKNFDYTYFRKEFAL